MARYTIAHSNGREDAGYESWDAALASARDYYRDLLGRHCDYERDDDGIVLRDPEDTADYAYLARIHEVV